MTNNCDTFHSHDGLGSCVECPKYVRKTTRSHEGKTYTNHLLVESVATLKRPRQRIICSLGSSAPAPPEQWLDLARRLEATLQG